MGFVPFSSTPMNLRRLNRFACAAGIAALVLPAAATEPTIHISVGGQISPGVYGRVDYGNAPPPPVLYPQPVVIVPPPRTVVVQQPPLYLHVPPGHAKNWRKHCRHYNACGRQVYFVRSVEYDPAWQREHERDRRGPGRGHDHDRHDHDRGRGHDRGPGHDR